ncbi:PID-CTERM protein-sorting domain-containing protein [Polluticoccus soli]|uniref:PID-CTERM protein-sorting domain-containing protein n=1 Tax=Polluticoccus soli TaxID=3034150 RepID=UPI0023E12678|nr:hypothetical protein [Flavipsychrobacter sp. JY13-12]
MRKILLLIALFVSSSIIAFAQPDPNDNPDIEVPIDGGVLFMAAAGAAYAIKKLKASKAGQTEDSSGTEELK